MTVFYIYDIEGLWGVTSVTIVFLYLTALDIKPTYFLG